MRIHFIAIGGSIMHNLALALHDLGHTVSGSDDLIYDPARSRLAARGLLPPSFGWFEERVDTTLDLVILGMHAHADNPELKKALDLGLKVMSFPEYLGEQALDKMTVAICGSHGKTTTTSMVMHILAFNGIDFDYAVGAQLPGFDTMVRLSNAPIMIIEGDEYLSSPLDRRPKFLHYHPDIAVITGVAWDHINVYPTYDLYLDSFRALISLLSEDDVLILNQFDDEVVQHLGGERSGLTAGYVDKPYKRLGEDYEIETDAGILSIKLFGHHNYQNLMAAWAVCLQLGLNDGQVVRAMECFRFPDKRMNIIREEDDLRIFRDYAHSPSKVRACVQALKNIDTDRQIIAVVELHTYSSLNKGFLPQYRSVLAELDHAFVFYNPVNLEVKRLPHVDADFIREAFDRKDIVIHTDKALLYSDIRKLLHRPSELLLMSSSNFGGLDWHVI